MGSRVSSPTFVGRREELDRVDAALTSARDGRAAFMLLAGEAGVGKTRFLHEVASHAANSGARVLEGGCIQLGGESQPFGPLVEALRGLTQMFAPDELDELMGAGRTELTRLMPILRNASDDQHGRRVGATSAQGRLFEHVLGMLGRLAKRAPVFLILEDIHWADRSTLELLAFLARNLHDDSVVLIASYRRDELHSGHPLATFVAEQKRAGRAAFIELMRFDRAELAEQMGAILGAAPDDDLVRRIMARSEGNAFYAEELLGASAEGLSDSLRDVLLTRVSTLSPHVQRVVRIASAGGTRISPTLLATVTGMTTGRIDEALRHAVDHQILAHRLGTEDRFAFRHALVQEAVYSQLLPGERNRLHAAFARALAEMAPAHSDAAHAAELAYHWQAAGDLPRAFAAWITAGIAAGFIYAEAEAREGFERALALIDQVPDAAARAPLDRVELLTRAALHAEGPEPSRSAAYIREAIALVDPAVDPTRAGLLHERLGQYSSTSADIAVTLAAYREGVRLVPTEPPSAARARVLAGLGWFLTDIGRPAEAAPVSEEALAVARAAGAPELESRALVALGFSSVLLGAVDAGLASLVRGREVAEAVGDPSDVMRAAIWRIAGLFNAGRFAEAVDAGRDAESYAIRHGLGARWAPTALEWTAGAQFRLGQFDEATETLGRTQRYELHGLIELQVEAQLMLMEAYRGDFARAERRVARVRELARQFPTGWTGALPGLALAQGDALGARLAVETMMAHPDTLTRHWGWALEMGIRAEADLAAQARARNSPSELAETRARSQALLTRMHAAMDDVAAQTPHVLPEVAAQLEGCKAEFSRIDGPDPDLWAARAATCEGGHRSYALMREGEATLALRRDRPRAARVLREAHEIAVLTGAHPLQRDISATAVRAAILLESPPPIGNEVQDVPIERHRRERPRRRGRYELTPREREVLALVVAGHSDAEIGDRLFISSKTASVHVSTIKAKLGARSRVEIATDAIALGLIEAPTAARNLR